MRVLGLEVGAGAFGGLRRLRIHPGVTEILVLDRTGTHAGGPSRW